MLRSKSKATHGLCHPVTRTWGNLSEVQEFSGKLPNTDEARPESGLNGTQLRSRQESSPRGKNPQANAPLLNHWTNSGGETHGKPGSINSKFCRDQQNRSCPQSVLLPLAADNSQRPIRGKQEAG